MNSPVQIKDVPVSVFLAVSIVVIFSLYSTTALKELPCGKDVMSLFYSNFVHIDLYHLFSNIFALYALSRVEVAIGGKKFAGLIVFLLLFNTLAEVTANKINKNLKCSIGFSGVLFGVAIWEIVTTKDIDLTIILAIVAMVALPSIQNPRASLLSHSIGALSGIMGGLIWNKLGPKIFREKKS